MNAIEKSFSRMKAKVKFTDGDARRRRGLPRSGYTIDVKDGTFIFNLGSSGATVNIQDADIADRHILINVRRANPDEKSVSKILNEKWLCGHDERDWFVAAAEGISVAEAKENLKPAEVRSLDGAVQKKKRNKRNNGVRLRQGEWFFVPAPELTVPADAVIHKNEPISRGRGSKKHYVEELYRTEGRTVYTRGIQVLEEKEFKKLRSDQQKGWAVRTADAEVYARGTIKHVDHNTIKLDIWHKVLMNTEKRDSRGSSLLFLD